MDQSSAYTTNRNSGALTAAVQQSASMVKRNIVALTALEAVSAGNIK